MISYCLNPNIVLNLRLDVVLQSIITLTANFTSVKILLDCFFGWSTSQCLWFLWSKWYFIVISGKLLQSIPSSLYYSFNQNIPSLSTIVFTSTPFLSYWSLFIHIVYSTEFSGFKLKHLNNFWRSLGMPLIYCKIEL